MLQTSGNEFSLISVNALEIVIFVSDLLFKKE